LLCVHASLTARQAAGVCAGAGSLLAIWLVYQHLLDYNEPRLQRYLVRIIFMLPVYAVDSYLSLLFKEYSLYFDCARDVYEAWVLVCLPCSCSSL
jgi:hypothetical protein